MEKNIEVEVEISVNEIIDHIEENNLSEKNLFRLKDIVDDLLTLEGKKFDHDLNKSTYDDVEIILENEDVIEYIEENIRCFSKREKEQILTTLSSGQYNIVNNWKRELFESVVDKYSYEELEELLNKK
jgi:vacuolar-type H+-ATPase subunit F/Vma7